MCMIYTGRCHIAVFMARFGVRCQAWLRANKVPGHAKVGSQDYHHEKMSLFGSNINMIFGQQGWRQKSSLNQTIKSFFPDLF